MNDFHRALPIVAFLVVASLPGFALDVGLSIHSGNIDFASNRASTTTTYSTGPLTFGVDATIGQQINDSTNAQVQFTMDPVLGNIVYGSLTYSTPYFVVAGGPLFGVFNSATSLIDSGLRAQITARLPGIAFVTLDSGSTFGTQLTRPGDYAENMSDIALGFYIRNAICSFHISQKGYTLKDSSGSVDTSLREYSVQTNIFQKNVPYYLLLKVGYQLQGKYFAYSTPITQTLGSIVVAARLDLTLTTVVTMNLGIESSLYTFGLDALTGTSIANTFLFRAFTGVVIHPFQ